MNKIKVWLIALFMALVGFVLTNTAVAQGKAESTVTVLPDTNSGMQFSHNLYRGCSYDNEAVKEDTRKLQKMLAFEGYYEGKIDGIFGELTKAAVIKWQKANGISPAYGFVGPISRRVLNRGFASIDQSEKEINVPIPEKAVKQVVPQKNVAPVVQLGRVDWKKNAKGCVVLNIPIRKAIRVIPTIARQGENEIPALKGEFVRTPNTPYDRVLSRVKVTYGKMSRTGSEQTIASASNALRAVYHLPKRKLEPYSYMVPAFTAERGGDCKALSYLLLAQLKDPTVRYVIGERRAKQGERKTYHAWLEMEDRFDGNKTYILDPTNKRFPIARSMVRATEYLPHWVFRSDGSYTTKTGIQEKPRMEVAGG